MRSLAPPAAAAAAALLASRVAQAGDVEFTSDSAFQAYEVRAPANGNVLVRRRFQTYLGVESFDVFRADGTRRAASGDGTEAEYTFRGRLRYDGDAGIPEREIAPAATASYLPEVFRSRFDVQYAYVDGRHLLGGPLAVRLGRQYVVDPLGYGSFDGARIALSARRRPLSVYGAVGGEVRGGLPLSSPRFEAQGAFRGARDGVDATLQPSFQQAAPAPLVGAGVEGTFGRLHLAAAWRKVWNTGAAGTDPFARVDAAPVAGWRVSTERAGASVSTFGERAAARAAFVWDVHLARVRSGFVSVDWTPTRRVTLAVDYDFLRPSFDGDTIWNFFAIAPTSDLGARASVRLGAHGDVGFGTRLRVFADPLGTVDAAGSAAGLRSYAGGGDASVRYRTTTLRAGARVDASASSDAARVGGDAYVERLWDDRFLTGARVSLYRFTDAQRTIRDATNVGWVGSFGYRFDPRTDARMELEHNVNRLYGGRFRLLVVLTVAVSK